MANKGQEGGLDSAGMQRRGFFMKVVTSELDLVRGVVCSRLGREWKAGLRGFAVEG